MAHDIAIGIDIGGTSIRVGLVKARRGLLTLRKAATPVGGPPGGLRATITRLVSKLVQSVGPHVASTPVGVALPGRWRPADTVMEVAVNLPALQGVNMRELFESALPNRPIHLFPDVSAAAYAQWRALDTPPQRFVYLTIGTGVGGCAILDGRVLDSTTGGPAHLGHLVVDTSPDAPQCRCGARGCLEACVCGPALERLGVNEMAVRRLAVGLQQLAHLFVPEVIAIGGGVIAYRPELVDGAAGVLATLSGQLVPTPRICRAPLPSDEAGVIGAGLRALEDNTRPPASA